MKYPKPRIDASRPIRKLLTIVKVNDGGTLNWDTVDWEVDNFSKGRKTCIPQKLFICSTMGD